MQNLLKSCEKRCATPSQSTKPTNRQLYRTVTPPDAHPCKETTHQNSNARKKMAHCVRTIFFSPHATHKLTQLISSQALDLVQCTLTTSKKFAAILKGFFFLLFPPRTPPLLFFRFRKLFGVFTSYEKQLLRGGKKNKQTFSQLNIRVYCGKFFRRLYFSKRFSSADGSLRSHVPPI